MKALRCLLMLLPTATRIIILRIFLYIYYKITQIIRTSKINIESTADKTMATSCLPPAPPIIIPVMLSLYPSRSNNF